MSVAPRPAELQETLTDIVVLARKIPDLYKEGHDYAYGGRGGMAEVKISGGGGGRPTEEAFHASGRGRHLLRKSAGKIRAAARLLEEADDLLDQIFDQGGPEYAGRTSVRGPGPGLGSATRQTDPKEVEASRDAQRRRHGPSNG